MELLGVRQPFTKFQEEKYQMLELNQRLESYLGRVKLLEEENKLLREEIHTLKSNRDRPGQRKAQEDALSQARRMMEEAWRKKDCVELEVENLMDDMEKVSVQRQKAKTAQAEAQRKLMESRKDLEEERRAQIWLREKVGQLEKDLLLQMQIHQDNMETLQASLKQTKHVEMAPQHVQTTSIPDLLGQEYSNRAAEVWQEAANNYQKQVGHLEESVNQAKANMAKIHQEKRENQHQVQHLAKELESMKTKRQMLEKHAMQQREEQKQELQNLQAQVDDLELEKDCLGQQIDSLMLDRQHLLQVKMSLGLEVATYRALLDGEGLRIGRPTTNKTNSSVFLDAVPKPTGNQSTTQTIAASCHLSSSVSTSHRSITSSRNLLTSATPSWTLTQGTPLRTASKSSLTEKTENHTSEETQKAAEEDLDHLQEEKVHDDLALESAPPKTPAEPKIQPEEIKVEDEAKQFQKAQIDEESALINVPADQPASLSQTPETESWAGPFTDPAGVSEEGKDEDTEVSVEMARISHAPKVVWEENKTVAEDDKDDASEMDVRSEIISESHTFAYGDTENDNSTITSSHISQNTNALASSFLEQGISDSVGYFGYKEEQIKEDELDNVSNISEEVTEQMNSESEAAIDSINEWDRQEETEPENETKVLSPDSEVEEQGELSIDTDKKDKTEDEEDTEQEQTEVTESEITVHNGGIWSKDLPNSTDHPETVAPDELNLAHTDNEDQPILDQSEGEEENKCDEDDSPNLSASSKTDPGEGDSCSQEHTLADTRPLIHYKSDDETSHHVGETTDSEDEKEKMDRGHWNESTSKRFNTMEDLTEEPDMDVTGEMMLEDVVSKEEELGDDMASVIFQNDSGVHESLDAVVQESELEGNLEEGSDDDDMRDENQQPIDNQHIHTEQAQDKTVHSYENQEHVNIECSSAFSETSQQEQMEGSLETLTMFQNVATTKKTEDLLDAVVQESELEGNLEEGSDDDDDMRDENQQLIENQHIHTEQAQDKTVHSYENQEHVNIECSSAFSETSQQEQMEGSLETLTMFQDVATTKESDLLDAVVQESELEGNLEEGSDDDDDDDDMRDENQQLIENQHIHAKQAQDKTVRSYENQKHINIECSSAFSEASQQEQMEGSLETLTMFQDVATTKESEDLLDAVVQESELEGNLEEGSDDDDDDDMRDENQQLIENQHIHAEQAQDKTVRSYENQKHINIECSSAFPEASQQEQMEGSLETLTVFQDVATTKEPEDLLDVSMHTNIDLMDSRSLESEINSQPDMQNSDQEECNSSEDESPNASQCFQDTSLLAAVTPNEQSLTFHNGVSHADYVSEQVSSEMSADEPKTSQIDDWENFNVWGKSMGFSDAAESTEKSMDEQSAIFPVSEKLESSNILPSLSENIFGKFKEPLERSEESFSKKVVTVMDFESNNSVEEFQSEQTKSEIHSFFSTSLKEDFWSGGKMETAATYDPVKTEDLKQAMVFGEEWRDMEGMQTTNGDPKEEMDILKGRDEKQKAEQPIQGKLVPSDDSVDEGDSWSSGDE